MVLTVAPWKAASLRPSAYLNNSLQAPYTSVSSTCGYSPPICSLCETVRISPRTVAAASEIPRLGTSPYFPEADECASRHRGNVPFDALRQSL